MDSFTALIVATLKNSQYADNVSAAYLFGSYAAGTQSDDSDIDILIELKKPMGLDFIRLQQLLSDTLRKPVDLQTKNSISPYILPYIEDNKVLLYEG